MISAEHYLGLLVFVQRKAHLPNGVTIERLRWYDDGDGHGEWRAAHGEDEAPADSEVRWMVSWGPKMGHFRTAGTLEGLIAELAKVP